MTLTWRPLLCSWLLLLGTPIARADDVEALNAEFWAWRATEQPFGEDDLPRIERPSGFAPDWTAPSVARHLATLESFEGRWARLAPPADAPVPLKVDWRLTGSALARVRWELSVERAWRRNPSFYVQQSLGSLFELLLPPSAPDEARQSELVARVRRIPGLLSAARANLTEARRPFVHLAIGSLEGAGARLGELERALAPGLAPANRRALHAALPGAIAALEHYRDWLREIEASTPTDTAIGREAYLWYLHEVALVPESPEAMRALARDEWARAVAFEALQQQRDVAAPAATRVSSAAGEIQATARREAEVRTFLAHEQLLTVPTGAPHYRTARLPPWLEPLQSFGTTDDLTGPSRLADDAVRYIPEPGPGLGFFYRSMAHDPRPVLVHEGVPGHYLQMWIGWHHADPVRRHYYDSVPNEGIGFYAEEMLLQAGLFDDDVRTRETIYSFMRLRALRVEVDVRLALGEFTIAEAADYLERTVPMDRASALEEAAMFASTPGQAISYQVGKAELVRLLSDARRAGGSSFSLQRFHDAIWREGNVPFSLQRWEMLGDPGDVPALLPPPAH